VKCSIVSNEYFHYVPVLQPNYAAAIINCSASGCLFGLLQPTSAKTEKNMHQ
jgi:hypothetical protein